MSFQFTRLMLKDWLVYGGRSEIAIPASTDGRNLVIFNGLNGYGKTSLLRGLRFVFEERFDGPSLNRTKSELRDLWNEHAARTGEGSLEVGVEFIHAGHTYRIIRGAEFKRWGDGVATVPWVKLIRDGVQEEAQVEEKISQILPRESLEFIFFDGAEISRYAKRQHEDGVRDAIEKVLGIPAVRNLRHDLEGLVRQLEEEQSRLLSESTQSTQLMQEIEALNDRIESHGARLDQHQEKRQSLAKLLEELNAEADTIQLIERERQELRDKRSRKADLEERLRELDGDVRNLISRSPLQMLKQPLRKIVESMQATAAPSQRQQQKQARLRVMKEIIEEDSCICGRPVSADVREHLAAESQRLQTIMAPTQGSQAPAEFLELAALTRSLEREETSVDDLLQRRAALRVQLEEIETDINRLHEKLAGHEDATVQERHEQIGRVKHELDEASVAISGLEEGLAQDQSELRVKQRELDKIGAGDEQAKGVTKTLTTTRGLLDAVTTYVERLTERKREDIQREATVVFRRITNKPQEYDTLRVKDDYTMEVVRQDGSTVDNQRLSAGEKEVVAYSFITALNLASSNPAPFVMDTPFGHLDASHRAGLLQSLPQLQVQAFLLATDRDLPASDRNAIEQHIASEFTLKRDQVNAITRIEEEA
jgi:DNA sulfur modification protein DndD